MAGSLRVVSTALAMLVGGAGPACAFGGGWGAGRSAYYPVYAAPVYGPIYNMPACQFMAPPRAAARPVKEQSQPLVKPIPKETKQTAEPPAAGKRAPIVIESRSLGGILPEASPNLPQGMARVGFWNITGRDVTLSIDGRQRTLAKDRAVTVDLQRSFTWQVNDGVLQTERVPGEQSTFEVIIRP
jgi:hypothetical protein